MKKAIIIGATSGIGNALARLLMVHEYKVGITGRKQNLLKEMKRSNPLNCVVKNFDCTTASNSNMISEMVSDMGGLDLLIFSAGIGNLNQDLGFEVENRANKLNVLAFTEIADWTYRFFERQGFGHFAAISSVAGLSGYHAAPAYHAAKSYQINYMEGLRQKAQKSGKPIYVSDIRPGFIDTAMAKGKKLFWVTSAEKAAKQIYDCIRRRKGITYVLKRWQIVAVILKLLPSWIHKRL